MHNRHGEGRWPLGPFQEPTAAFLSITADYSRRLRPVNIDPQSAYKRITSRMVMLAVEINYFTYQ